MNPSQPAEEVEPERTCRDRLLQIAVTAGFRPPSRSRTSTPSRSAARVAASRAAAFECARASEVPASEQ